MMVNGGEWWQNLQNMLVNGGERYRKLQNTLVNGGEWCPNGCECFCQWYQNCYITLFRVNSRGARNVFSSFVFALFLLLFCFFHVHLRGMCNVPFSSVLFFVKSCKIRW